MPSTSFFTTHDGDVILRATQEPSPTQDFRVHKLILSLASPVFKDMFTLPESPDRNRTEPPEIPVVDVPDSPQIVDTILRFIYSGVEPPKVSNVATLAALFSTADKYNITSIHPVLKASMKTFLPRNSFMVYITACRFGLLEEAMEAARVSTPLSILKPGDDEAVQHVSGPDLYRFIRFVQERDHQGRSIIKQKLGWSYVTRDCDCPHWEGGEDFYFRLTRVVQDEFVENPCLDPKDLLMVLSKVPDPPLGCDPQPNSAEWYYNGGDDDAFSCPFSPMSIRDKLMGLVMELEELECSLLKQAFKE